MLERFDAYMERCLYDPDNGFYTAGRGSAGRRQGDFITSPEVGPLFADVLAAAVQGWWEELGRPVPLTVYDVGSGPGTLGRALARTAPTSPAFAEVRAIDRVPAPGVSAGDLPPDLRGAVVIANELLDNCPVRIVERSDAGWSEVWVRTGTGDEGTGPVEELRPLPHRPPRLAAELERVVAPGTRLPVLDAAAEWVSGVLARRPAVLVVFDYGARTTAELAERCGWLRTYRNHQQGSDPLLDPGRCDITSDVAVDQLPAPDDVVDQATFLTRWGIDDLVEEGRRYWTAHAGAPDVSALRMRSRLPEAEALLDPTGLGSWLVCTWTDFAASRRN